MKLEGKGCVMGLIGQNIPLAAVLLIGHMAWGAFEPKWESLDSRPVPQWWTDAKFGVFVHWGPYAVPAYAPTDADSVYTCYAEWYHGRLIETNEQFCSHHKKHYGNAPYGNFAAEFKAENFNPSEWAALFKKSGAKYAVLTSKHHDGYALWPSAVTPYYNSVSIGSGRDLAGEFTAAMKEAGLKSGFYYSLLEYANPLYPKKRTGANCSATLPMREWAARINLPQMKELVERYKADIIWPDGEWDWSDQEHRSLEFLSWLYNDSIVRDTVVVNDRWGAGCRGRHGGHYTVEYGNSDEGVEQVGEYSHPWEECRGIGNSFGFNRYETPDQYMSREECIETLVSTVSRGGNLLLNVGPTADGLIPAIMQDRLLAIGRWLSVNGEAIYASRRSRAGCRDKRVYITAKDDVIYAIDFRPNGMPFVISGVRDVAGVTLLGSNVKVEFDSGGDAVTIVPPSLAPAAMPCECARCYRIRIRR